MKIVLLVEGATEKVFIPYLRCFLKTKVKNMPKLLVRKYDGRILGETKDNLLTAVNSCSELKALVNTILRLCGEDTI